MSTLTHNERDRLLDLEATVGAIQVLMRRARDEGSKVLALEALDQAFGIDETAVDAFLLNLTGRAEP